MINNNGLHVLDCRPAVDNSDDSIASYEIEKYKLTNIHLQYVTRLDIGLDFEFDREIGKSHFVVESLIRIRSRLSFILIIMYVNSLTVHIVI